MVRLAKPSQSNPILEGLTQARIYVLPGSKNAFTEGSVTPGEIVVYL